MPFWKKQLGTRELEIEKNKEYIKDELAKIKELTGISISLSDEEIDKRASNPEMSIEKSNFLLREDFNSRDTIEALYNNFDEYGINRNMMGIMYSPEYMEEREYDKAMEELTARGMKLKAVEETKVETELDKRIKKNKETVDLHLADEKLMDDEEEFNKVLTEDLIELRVLEDAKNGKRKLEPKDLTDNGLKAFIAQNRKNYNGISKMVEGASVEELVSFAEKHGPSSNRKAEKEELDRAIYNLQGKVLLSTYDKKSINKEEYKELKHDLIKLYILDVAKNGELNLNKDEIEPKAMEERVSKMEGDYPEIDDLITKSGVTAIRRYIKNPYESMIELIDNKKDGIDLKDIERAKVNSLNEEYAKADFERRKMQISDWLQRRADSMAAKFTQGKQKEDKDLAMIMIVQGMQKKIEDKNVTRAELESFFNPDVIDNNAEKLAKDPDFKTVSKTHLKNDYENFKSGKIFNAMVQEKKKSIDAYNTNVEKTNKERVAEANLAAKKANEDFVNSKEGRLENKLYQFNRLKTVREKEAFIEREFRINDLKHVDKFNPDIREKLEKAQKFIVQANARKYVETPPEKREEFLRKIGGSESHTNAVINEANAFTDKVKRRQGEFIRKNGVVLENKKEQQPYLGM